MAGARARAECAIHQSSVHLNPQGKTMMNSKLSMAVAAAVALFATPFAAQAADMPTKGYYKAPPRSVISYYN